MGIIEDSCPARPVGWLVCGLILVVSTPMFIGYDWEHHWVPIECPYVGEEAEWCDIFHHVRAENAKSPPPWEIAGIGLLILGVSEAFNWEYQRSKRKTDEANAEK